MELYSRSRARRSLLDTAILRAASQVSTLAGYIVMVRGMTEHEFGVYNLLYTLIPAISAVASLGLEHTLRRYQPEYLQEGNLPAAARLLSFVSVARFVSNLLVIGAILLLWDSVSPVFKLAPYRTEFLIFSVIVLLHFQASILQLALASRMLHRLSVGMFGVLSLVRLVTYSGFVLFGTLTLQTALYSDIAAYAIAYAGLRAAQWRHCRSPERGYRFGANERRRLFRYAIFNNFNDTGSIVLSSRSDNLFIAAFLDPLAVGAYSFYRRLAEMAGNIRPTRMFENVVHPLLFATRREEAPERMPRYFTALVNTSLLVQMPMLAYAVVYHREIVTVLFGGKFLEHSLLMPLVFAFATLNVIATPAVLVAHYAEKAGILLLSKIFIVWHVAALLLLIPAFGIYGAMIASGSAELLRHLFVWWHVRDAARWTNFGAVLGSSALIWGAFVAAGYVLKAVLPPSPLLQLAGGAVLAAAAFLAYLRSGALSAADRRLVERILHGREARLLRWLGVLPAR